MGDKKLVSTDTKVAEKVEDKGNVSTLDLFIFHVDCDEISLLMHIGSHRENYYYHNSGKI